MTKTTINIDENLWKKFSIIVIQNFGGRKMNDVITELIKEYVEKNEKKAAKPLEPIKAQNE
jgi:metal-responsive CopG/Arc/MetJ family transcriptional regulator